jgi:outer membrane receptor protein involved in Fe transport
MKILFAILVATLLTASTRAQSLLEGRVTDSAGKPLPGAELVLKRGGVELRRSADADGRFRYLALPAGEYELVISAAGYYSAEQELAVRPRQPVVVQIALAPTVSAKETLEVRSADISLGETASARLLTHAELAALPEPLKRDLPTLALSTFPGATLSHDNFVHVRGNEVSLQEFINGISFLENPQEQFSPGLSPEVFEAVSMVSGSFAAEYGNRFGGVFDATTRSGHDLRGHGALTLGGGTYGNSLGSAEYGNTAGKFGYYLFAGGFTSDWYLNPPEPKQLHDFGFGLRGAGQFDYRGTNDRVSLFLAGGGTNFELPNLQEDQVEGRNAARRLRSQTAILTWEHVFSPSALITSSIYERTLDDRLAPTTDPVTPFGDGRRSSLTAGVKSDVLYARGRHIFKAGVDLTRLRLSERFAFDAREVPLPPEDPAPFSFRGKALGGQASLYAQDHISLTSNWTAELGLRWDYFDLAHTYSQVSPRLALSYHIPSSKSTLHFAYNRFFSPPPLEYVQLANFFGAAAPDPGDRVGPMRPYRQHYFEGGLIQELHPKVAFELTGFYHRGTTPFEYREISITRLFLPINSARSSSYGVEAGLTLKNLEKLGLSARLQYAYQRTFFFGPISGGFALGEEVQPGEKFLPAFDEPHSGTLSLTWRRKWREFFAGSSLRYGSGTAAQDGKLRLPGHATWGLSGGFNLWRQESRRVALECNLVNLTDDRYRIAKESEETPIQFASPRVVSGHLKFQF